MPHKQSCPCPESEKALCSTTINRLGYVLLESNVLLETANPPRLYACIEIDASPSSETRWFANPKLAIAHCIRENGQGLVDLPILQSAQQYIDLFGHIPF